MSARHEASTTDRGSEPAHPTGQSINEVGMTIREHLAGQAMQGLLANPKLVKVVGEKPAPMTDSYAGMALEAADALLKELEKGASEEVDEGAERCRRMKSGR